MAYQAKEKAPLEVRRIATQQVTFCILGTSPMIFNSTSEKTRQQLLLPRPGKMSTGEKASTLKHNPPEEFRASTYRDPNEDADTLLRFPAGAFKKAIATAALRMPGNAKKTEIGQMTWTLGEWAPIWGTPLLYMAIVKQAGIQGAPDIRTRALLERWATKVTFKYTVPMISGQVIAELLAGAGLLVGIGDGRQEKGTFSYGQWDIVDEDDPRFLAVQQEDRPIQVAALANPVPRDEMSQELLEWFGEEFARRRDAAEGDATPKPRGRKPRTPRINGHDHDPEAPMPV